MLVHADTMKAQDDFILAEEHYTKYCLRMLTYGIHNCVLRTCMSASWHVIKRFKCLTQIRTSFFTTNIRRCASYAIRMKCHIKDLLSNTYYATPQKIDSNDFTFVRRNPHFGIICAETKTRITNEISYFIFSSLNSTMISVKCSLVIDFCNDIEYSMSSLVSVFVNVEIYIPKQNKYFTKNKNKRKDNCRYKLSESYKTQI